MLMLTKLIKTNPVNTEIILHVQEPEWLHRHLDKFTRQVSATK